MFWRSFYRMYCCWEAGSCKRKFECDLRKRFCDEAVVARSFAASLFKSLKSLSLGRSRGLN